MDLSASSALCKVATCAEYELKTALHVHDEIFAWNYNYGLNLTKNNKHSSSLSTYL